MRGFTTAGGERRGAGWAGLALMALAGSAWGQALPPVATPLRVCSWNVTNYSTTSFGGRDANFQTSFYGVIPAGLALAGQSMYPDVIIGQEFISAAAVANFRNMLNTAPGSPGDWVAAPFRDGADTDSAFFFRSTKVQLLNRTGGVVSNADLANPGVPTGTGATAAVIIAVGSSSTSNQPRNTVRYDFAPVGYTGSAARIGAYSVHLKAQGSNSPPPGENAQGRRLVETQRIRANASGVDTNGAGSALPAGYQYIIAGDTNIQTSSAPDYQAMVGASITGWTNGSLVFVSQTITGGRVWDPINSPGSWNNNSAFRYIHTQDPAATGQMDDRHDQILLNASLLDGDGLDYLNFETVPYFSAPNTASSAWTFSTSTWNDPGHTYRAWGNDGSAYDLPLRTTGNTFVGATIATAIQATASGGGHLPVIVDLRVPAIAAVSTSTIDFGTVTVGDLATRVLEVFNAGEVARWTAGGISPLNYTVSVTGAGFSTPAGSFTEAAGGGRNSHVVTLNTSAPGTFSGTVTISAPGAVDTPAVVVTLTGTVQAASTACVVDYNGDTFINLDDLGDFISDFYLPTPVPGGVQPAAPTYGDAAIGFGVPCPTAGDAAPPYAAGAYRALGYRVGFSPDGSNACPVDAETPFPNLDNLSDFVTAYYQGC